MLLSRCRRYACFALLACVYLSLQSCGSVGEQHVTFPAPHPAIEGAAASNRAPDAPTLAPLESVCTRAGIEPLSLPDSLATTHDHAGFTIADVGFCFYRPLQRTTAAGSGFQYSRCERQTPNTLLAPPPPSIRNTAPLTFKIYVEGRGLSFNRLSGTLSGHIAMPDTAIASVRSFPATGSPSGLDRFLLTIDFDQFCDPDVRYKLSISGLTKEGRPLLVPAVDFDPSTEVSGSRTD